MKVGGAAPADGALGGFGGGLRAVSGGVPVMLFALDREGVLLLWESEDPEALGLEPGEKVVGRSAFEVYGEGSRNADDLRRVLSGQSFVSRLELPGASFRCLYNPLRGEGGAVVGAVGVAVDATGRGQMGEALRESEERFRLTFEQAAVGMAHVAPEGRWLRVNEKLLQIVGYGDDEILSLSFQDITHPDDLHADLRHVERMLAGEIQAYSMEKRYLRKDGRRIWVHLSVTLVREASGEPAYFISMVEDVTARKLREILPEELTDRELEVLQLVARARTNPQIAQDLRHSLGTVKLDVRRILAKLGVENRAEATAKAIEIGLISPPGQPLLSNGRRRIKKLSG